MTMYKDPHTRWQFANVEELVDYVADLVDVEPLSKQSIRIKNSQARFLRKVSPSEGNVTSFRNPLLNYVTSPHGEIRIGSRSFNVRAPRLAIPNLYPTTNNFTAAQAFTCYTDFSGLEFCQSDDGRKQTFTDDKGSMSFRSYRESNLFGLWSNFGAEIRTFGSSGNFEAAIINSRYFDEAYAQTCAVEYDSGSDTNDNVLDVGETWIADTPLRVESLCRVQWNGRRLSGVVYSGNDCFAVGTVQPWPEGYPEDWPPLSQPDPIETIAVRPAFLEFTSRPSRPSVTKTITLTSSFLSPVTVTVEDATVDLSPADPSPFDPPSLGGELSGEFSNVSGQLTIPPGGSGYIPVTFTGESGLGSIPGSLRVTWSSGQFTLNLLGTLVEERFLF